jgi:hypothetical protein
MTKFNSGFFLAATASASASRPHAKGVCVIVTNQEIDCDKTYGEGSMLHYADIKPEEYYFPYAPSGEDNQDNYPKYCMSYIVWSRGFQGFQDVVKVDDYAIIGHQGDCKVLFNVDNQDLTNCKLSTGKGDFDDKRNYIFTTEDECHKNTCVGELQSAHCEWQTYQSFRDVEKAGKKASKKDVEKAGKKASKNETVIV